MCLEAISIFLPFSLCVCVRQKRGKGERAIGLEDSVFVFFICCHTEGVEKSRGGRDKKVCLGHLSFDLSTGWYGTVYVVLGFFFPVEMCALRIVPSCFGDLQCTFFNSWSFALVEAGWHFFFRFTQEFIPQGLIISSPWSESEKISFYGLRICMHSDWKKLRAHLVPFV